MALLPRDARSQQRVLGVVLLLGGAVLFHLYVYLPRQEAVARLGERVERLEHGNRLARIRTGDLDRTREELERAERLLAALRELVPRDADVADIYEELAARSEALGLELVSVDPSSEAGEEGAYYRRQRWDMILEGRYHDLGSFLARVASLPRIVRPSVRSIEALERTQEGTYPVRAEVVLETFVLGGGGSPYQSDGEGEDGS